MIAQRCSTMNIFEKLLSSPYGRPLYRIITGKDVPEKYHSDIYEIFVLKKNVLEACVEDTQHDLYSYEFLQKQMHITSNKHSVRFSERFSEAGQKMISEEKNLFGKQLTKGLLAMMKAIC